MGRSNGLKYDCLLFDMDDTLYPMSSGLTMACRKNIEDYMLEHLHIDENQIPNMCLELYKEHGTTMAGLKALGFEFDNDEFHAYVHGKLPYDVLRPDPVLRNLLLSMPQRKIIFTNADKAHAAQVLNRLGLEDCFEGVICFETLNPPLPKHPQTHGIGMHDDILAPLVTIDAKVANNTHCFKTPILCKPAVEAIEAALIIANADPTKTIFFDDSIRNIASGKATGLHTVIVGSSNLVPGADHALSSIHNVKEALPELWEGEQGENLEQVLIQSATVETVVA